MNIGEFKFGASILPVAVSVLYLDVFGISLEPSNALQPRSFIGTKH